MKKYLLVFIVVFCGIILHAQQLTYTVDQNPNFILEPLNADKLREIKSFREGNDIIQFENQGVKAVKFYTAKYGTQMHQITFRKIDQNGKVLMVNDVEKGEKNFGPLPDVPVEFKNKLLLFYCRYDKDSMKLYVSEINKSDLVFLNAKLLYSYAQKNSGLVGMRKILMRRILVRKSPDENEILVAIQGEKNEYFSAVIGPDIDITRKKTSVLPLSEEDNIQDGAIDKNGNSVFLIANSGKPWPDDFALYPDMYSATNYLVLQTSGGKEKFIKCNTLLQGKEFYNVHFKASQQSSKLYVFGDYSSNGGVEGIWLSEINTDQLELSKPVLYLYPDDIRKTFSDLKLSLKDKKSFAYSNFSMVEFENGDMAICGYSVSPWYGGGPVGFFGDPIVSLFITNNKSDYKYSILPRKLNDPLIADGIYIPFKDKLVVLYNDFTINLIRDSLQANGIKPKAENYPTASLAYAIINKNGVVEKKHILINRQEIKMDLSPNECRQISTKEVVIPSRYYAQKDLEHKLAIIKIE